MMSGQSYAYDGVLGGKTGYTNDAGCTLVTYAKRGNSVLVAVVLNSINGAFPDTTSLLDYGFDHFQRVDLNVDLVNISEYGGWDEVQEKHFTDGGIFDEIYER